MAHRLKPIVSCELFNSAKREGVDNLRYVVQTHGSFLQLRAFCFRISDTAVLAGAAGAVRLLKNILFLHLRGSTTNDQEHREVA